jgi:ABC-2 type transport system permease protein
MNIRRLRAVLRKEFLHIRRDPRSLTLALALPLTMILLFGYALTLDVDRIPTLIYDQNKTPESRELIDQFRGSRYFQIQGSVDSYAPAQRAIDQGAVLLTVAVDRDYAKDLLAGKEANVQLLLDGSDSNTASIAIGYAEAVVATYALQKRSDAQEHFGGGKLKNPVEPRIRVWYNSDLKSRNYIVPGLIAVTLMIIASLLTSLTIAREWENGTMEQLLSTPLRPAELILGKLLAYFALGLVDMIVCLIAAVFVFHVPLRGNVWFLFFTSCLFLFGTLCWGLFISASNRSQLLAYQMGLLSSFLPGYLLSGFLYSIGNMPKVIQVVSYLIPARYFIKIINSIFLKGVGFRTVYVEVLLLTAYAGIVFFAATRKMRQKVA